MKTAATYTDYKVWRAALKATYPKAELRVSSGCHLDEYAALPNGKNVAWFGHDNNTGWIERASLVPDLSAIPGLDEPATLPKVNRALRKLGVKDTLIKGKGYYYFFGDEASDWYSSSVPVYRISQLTLRQVLEEYYSLKERKGKTVSSKQKKTRDRVTSSSNSEWVDSEWWPKKADPDDDPRKIAIFNMLASALKGFPAGLAVNTSEENLADRVFGSPHFDLYAFEDMLDDVGGDPDFLKDTYSELKEAGSRFTKLILDFEKYFIATDKRGWSVIKAMDKAATLEGLDYGSEEYNAAQEKRTSILRDRLSKLPRFEIQVSSRKKIVVEPEITLDSDLDNAYVGVYIYPVVGSTNYKESALQVSKDNYSQTKVLNTLVDMLAGDTDVDFPVFVLNRIIDYDLYTLTRLSGKTKSASKAETAAPKDAGNYTYFKLRSPKLTINRRGKPVTFKKGDPLGWRFSGSGKFLRLISPLTGPTIVYSIEINDDVLKWLDKQDPNSKRKRGQLKSDRPEDGQNRLEGYVVTDGTRYYKLEPKPIFSRKIKPRVIYTKEQDAKRFAAKFPQKKLKVKEVYTKDLGKVLSKVQSAFDVYMTDLPRRDQPSHNDKVAQFISDLDRNLKKNGYTRAASYKRSAMAEVHYNKGSDNVYLAYHHGTGRYGSVKAFLSLHFNDTVVVEAPDYADTLPDLLKAHDEAMKKALEWSKAPGDKHI